MVLLRSNIFWFQLILTGYFAAGYTYPDIRRCVDWMSSFALALRERSPLQPKSFHGVAPDDAHHLQTHSVDLDLLQRAQDRLALLQAGGLRDSPDPATQTAPTGLQFTPQEEEGDIMFPKGMQPAPACPPTAGLLSPNSSLNAPDLW